MILGLHLTDVWCFGWMVEGGLAECAVVLVKNEMKIIYFQPFVRVEGGLDE